MAKDKAKAKDKKRPKAEKDTMLETIIKDSGHEPEIEAGTLTAEGQQVPDPQPQPEPGDASELSGRHSGASPRVTAW